jgi:hypothetical protein
VKWLLVIIGIVAAGLGIFGLQGKDGGTHRFRLSLTVDTPLGERTASSVLQVSYSLQPTVTGDLAARYVLKGEAVFLDLGAGKNVVMLLTHGPKGDSVDAIAWLPTSVLLGLPAGYTAAEALARGGKTLAGSAELKPPFIPTLVTFTDINDPASAKVVYATAYDGITTAGSYYGTGIVPINDFAYVLGPGYAFKRATLGMVPVGIWPLNLIGITGTPVTQGIEGKVPALKAKGRPAAVALRAASLNTGASIDAESAFIRN